MDMSEEMPLEPMLYFGYGSNLDHVDWTKWCHRKGRNPDGLKEISPAWLDEYYLTFDYYSSTREAGAANLKLLASGRAATPGALFEIDADTLASLDRKEGHPNPKYYQRKIVTAYTPDGKAHQAYTYIHYAKEDNFHPPSQEYENLIRNGLERLDLTTDWLDSALDHSMSARFEYVFVYGTLMEGMSRHSEMQDGCTLVCEGTVQGNLYHISDYPGLVAGNGTVQGELYRASDMFQIIQRLDWIEGAGGTEPLFNRVIQQVNTERGKVWAYTYHYAKSTDSFDKIVSGNWRN